MKKNIENILVTIVIILIFVLININNRWYYKKKIDEERRKYNTELIRNDSLIKVSETQYSKLIADTLTISQLNRKVKQLQIELKAKPKVITETKYIPKEIEKEVEVVKVVGDTVKIEDYYPNKESYFVKYENEISIKDKKGSSKFFFNPLKVTSVVSQRKDGLFQVDFKTPEWLEISSVNIQSTPLEKEKVKNFGILIGAGIGRNFDENKNNIRIESGIRFKRMYLDLGFNTSNTADLTLKFEL